MDFADQFSRAWEKFADHGNRLAKKAQAVSPDSPDFAERVRGEWDRQEVSRWFRELEDVIRDGR